MIALAQHATPITIAALPPAQTRGAGAPVPFTEYEAENAATNGRIIGPDRRFTTIAAEASGRRAVRLQYAGDYVEFVLARPANAVTVRAAIPDGAAGEGRDAALDVLIDGRPAGALDLTSRYGWYYGAYPFTNRPADGTPHHYFDDGRLMFARTLPPGTRVRLQVPSTPAAAWFVIDLADLEQVPPPLERPAGSLSVVDRGADPSGRRSSRAAFDQAIAFGKAHRVPVWIPPGNFRVEGHLVVDSVTIRGAGPWYSVVQGPGLGFYGLPAPGGSHDVRLADFTIAGEVMERKDDAQVNGIGGALSESVISNLFIRHEKVGIWLDGPMHDLRIDHLRITDTAADGINFHRGVSHAVVEDTFVRNTGDDGLAAWSQTDPDHDIVFRNDTVIAPILANGIALYGGRDLRVEHSLVADTLTEGGGLHVGNRFDAVPVAGTITLSGNVVVRGGSVDPHWHFGVGALWLYALDAPIAATIGVRDTRLIDSSDDAVTFIGKPIARVTVDRLAIDGAGGAGVALRSAGQARIAGSTASGLREMPVRRCDVTFTLRDGGGNHGFGNIGRSSGNADETGHACGEIRE